MNRRHPLSLALSSLILAALACSLPGLDRLTSSDPSSTPTSAITESHTPTPIPPQPATLVEHQPARGEELHPEGEVLFYFDQAMQPTSVEAAFHITPPVDGDLRWEDPATLAFQPKKPLSLATQYTFQIDAQAQSQAGLALQEPIAFSLTTSGYIQVTSVSPSPGSYDVDPSDPITVAFNRPIVPLQIEDSQIQPLRFDPPVPGEGRWIDTALYQFTPEDPLPSDTLITAQVQSGLADPMGGILPETYVWSFQTSRPHLTSIEPLPGGFDIPLDSPIVLGFNHRMDADLVEDAFKLRDSQGTVISGSFTWSSELKQVTFQPYDLLAYQADYTITLEPELEGGVQEGFYSTFQTVPTPAVLNTYPSPGNSKSYDYHLTISFTSSMDEASLVESISIEPEIEGLAGYWRYDTNQWVVYGDFEPQTSYVLTLRETAQDVHGTPLGQALTLPFTTPDLPPLLQKIRYGEVLSMVPSDAPSISIQTRNLDRLDYQLYQLDDPAFQSALDLGYQFPAPQPNTDPILFENQMDLQTDANQLTTIDLPLGDAPLSPGAYWLTVRSVKGALQPLEYLILVRNIELVFKSTPQEVLVWAVDLLEGGPAANLPLQLIGEGGVELAQGETDAEGLLQLSYPLQENRYDRLYIQTGASAGDKFGFTASNWADGIQSYRFGVWFNSSLRDDELYLYTDRPIYRPGQTVRYRGMLRDVTNEGYQLPETSILTLALIDSYGDAIASQQVELSPYGTFHGEFELSDEAQLGAYLITTDGGNVSFDVAAYRKPELSLNITPAVSDAVMGEKVQVTLEGAYYSGGPIADAMISWTATPRKSTNYGMPQAVDWFDLALWNSPIYANAPLAEGTGQTDQQGRLIITIPTDQMESLPADVRISASIIESSGFSVAAQASFRVHPANVYLSLVPPRYAYQVGEEALVRLHASNWEAEPVADQLAQIEVSRLKWKQTVDMKGNVTWQAESTPVNAAALTTTEDGSILFSFAPQKPGSYLVHAIGFDKDGRKTEASVNVWVAGEGQGYWRQPSANRIALVPDREQYTPGQIARVLVPSPFKDPTPALITIEREGVLSRQTRMLEGADTLLEIPMEEAYAPNVYITVTLIQPWSDTSPAGLAVGMAELSVSAESKRLQLELTPIPSQSEPGEEVQFILQAREWDGQPAQAEFSLALVDLAALAMAEPNKRSPFDAFYRRQPLRVLSAASLSMQSLETAAEASPPGIGGGGGDFGITSVRSEFPDTAYWNPRVVTDAQGKATISLQLPDSLTTWRMDARGVTLNTSLGSVEADLVVSKDLFIRPVTPRFFTAGDEASVAAVVHNNTGETIEVDATLLAGRAEITSPPQVQLELAPGGESRVTWTLSIPAIDFVDLTFKVVGAGMHDASKPTLGDETGRIPVLRYTAPFTAAAAGLLESAEQRIESINLPRSFDAIDGTLRISLDPALGSAMQSALGSFESQEWNNTEVIASRLLSSLVTWQTLDSMHMLEPALADQTSQSLEQSLQLLQQRQNLDGGWGWCPGSESDPYLSAYALFALSKVKQSDFPSPELNFESAVELLQATLVQPGLVQDPGYLNRQAFILFALAQAGAGDSILTSQMAAQREVLDPSAIALLAHTLADLNPQAPQLANLMSDLHAASVRSATGAHWEDTSQDHANLASSVRSTALAIKAMIAIDPQQEAIPDAVRWLLTTRTPQGGWTSSHETAWALIALADWFETSGAAERQYTYAAALNGQTLAAGETTGGAPGTPVEILRAVSDLYSDAPNLLTIERGAGSGSLAYSAFLTVYQQVDEANATSRGLSVSRRYLPTGATCTSGEENCIRVTQAEAGEDILVQVSLVVPDDQYYVTLEDPYPAGMEPLDPGLATSPFADPTAGLGEDADPDRGWGWRFFTHAEYGDQHLRLFAPYLPAGSYQYTYQLHALLPGEYQVLPTRAWAQYMPEVFGQSEGQMFIVTEYEIPQATDT